MARDRRYAWPITTCIIAVLLVLIALPQKYKTWAPGFIRSPSLHFGLDLAGGTQLDFRISEREMQEQIESMKQDIEELKERGDSPERLASLQLQLTNIQEQQRTIVEAIRTVLERRINALGVSEAVITPSYVGDEKHLLVECPGVVDTQVCIDTVGKTIALEFKEQFTEATEEYEAEVRERVVAAQRRITESGHTLAMVGEDLGTEIGIGYLDRTYFRDEIPAGIEAAWNQAPARGVVQYEGSITRHVQNESGQIEEEELPGIYLVEAASPRTQTGRLINEAPTAFDILVSEERDLRHNSYTDQALDSSIPTSVVSSLRSMQQGDLLTVAADDGSARVLFLRLLTPGRESMEASHILISYQGANAADDSVTRTKEEALAFAQDLKKQLDEGANFTGLARQHSDGPSGENGGSLGEFGRSAMVPAFEQVAFALTDEQVSDPVETQFGYHLIRADRAAAVGTDVASFDELVVPASTQGIGGQGAFQRADALLTRLQTGNVLKTEEVAHLRTLFFSLVPTGWKDTALDGKHFRTATVTLDPTTNLPIVQIMFDEEGGRLFQELTKNNIGQPLGIFVGGQLISAPTVQAEIAGGTAVITGSRNFDEAKSLATDLNTGAIPAPIFLTGTAHS